MQRQHVANYVGGGVTVIFNNTIINGADPADISRALSEELQLK